jgi:hypothetical protein
MTDRRNPDPDGLTSGHQPVDDGEPVLTTPEDVASAGRSCMAIVVLGALIVLVLVLWVVYRALGG